MTDKRFFSIADLADQPRPMWLIDGLIEVNTLAMLAGPPGSMKSFLALDWMLSMTSQRKWHGRITRPSKVLYVLGEGRASALKRINAWMLHHKVTEQDKKNILYNFRISFDVPQMAQKSSVDNMLASLVEEKFFPDVIFIDTFARSFVGLDENSQKDTGIWIEQADHLRQLGYTVIFLHHTAKNTEFGLKYRGSTAIMGAMDTAMTLQRDGESQGRVKLVVTKQKDHDEGDPLYFQRLIVKEDYKDEGSIVLIPSVKIDEQFSLEGRKIEEALIRVMADHTFESDRARARAMTTMCDLSEMACQSRIKRARQIKGELDKCDL